jgi:hypothetical protein
LDPSWHCRIRQWLRTSERSTHGFITSTSSASSITRSIEARRNPFIGFASAPPGVNAATHCLMRGQTSNHRR